MATPNDPGQPKKPQVPPQGTPQMGKPAAKPPAAAGPPGAKPAAAGQPAQKPAAAGQPPAKPAAKPQTPPPGAAKPAAAKPQAAPGKAPAPQPGAKPALGKLANGGPAKPAASQPAAGQPAAGQPAAGQPAAGQPAAKPSAGKPPAKDTKKSAPVKANVASRSGGRKLGQVLVDLGFIDDDQLWELLDESKNSNTPVGQVALGRGLVTEDQLLQALADQFGLRVLPAEELKPSTEALQLVPETMASVYKILPLSYKDKALTVVLGDPVHLPALDDLRNFLGIKEVQAVLANPKSITEVLSKCYLGKEETIMDIIQALQEDPELSAARRNETSIDLESLMEIQDAAPVRKLLNMVMLLAIKDHASDIHFEPFEDEYKMRYRCDGVLYEMVPPPRHLASAISSRIKVMSNLDIAERRLPQDGRIELNVGGNTVDMRVSVLPTMFGESVVIRVLDRGVVQLDLNKLGMPPDIQRDWREIIRKPNGIILVTGPTGSGKTTTLYSSLNELNEITDKIITCEDPVEYDIDGVIQVPINTEIDVTFANVLRSILRQDPDKILVGEVRDLETAEIAIQASLTGHMVFSTLHTNDAPSSITRLRDMGVETYLITATLEAILAQRLVRKICEDCRSDFEPSQEMLMEMNLRPQEVAGKKFYYGKGCDRCNNTGHRGRVGIFELIIINDELRDMISAGASTDQLRAFCRRQGMVTLRESGLRAIFSGATTIDEVVRETVLEEEL
jgi:type IV pilus assembly protein PilB